MEIQNDDALVRVCRALGDPVRMRLLRRIANARLVPGLTDGRCQATAGVCFCQLCDEAGLTAATVSHHIKILREAGIVEGIRVGRWTYYRMNAGFSSSIERAFQQLVG
jgi:ArsR family transcriptional regulator